MAAAAEAARRRGLLPLREEIAIFPGPAALDGSPSWTLHDPARNRFYRLGWQEFEILSRWDSATVDAVVERVKAETTLRVEREDVDELDRFLFSFDLLRATSPQRPRIWSTRPSGSATSLGQWLLHNYLFIRIPLLQPRCAAAARPPQVIYPAHFIMVIVVPLPTVDWMSISSISRLVPGKPIPNPPLVL